MDIKSVATTAKMVIESLVVLLDGEGGDIESIKMDINGGNQKLDFKKLIDLAVSELKLIQDGGAEVPEGFVLVEKKNTEDWYLDDSEGMWWDRDGIDGSLCELDIGEVQAVEHKEYLITENNTLYAAKTWDDANDQVDYWQFFKTKEEAEKAAAYCKTKFNDEPIEAQEQSND